MDTVGTEGKGVTLMARRVRGGGVLWPCWLKQKRIFLGRKDTVTKPTIKQNAEAINNLDAKMNRMFSLLESQSEALAHLTMDRAEKTIVVDPALLADIPQAQPSVFQPPMPQQAQTFQGLGALRQHAIQQGLIQQQAQVPNLTVLQGGASAGPAYTRRERGRQAGGGKATCPCCKQWMRMGVILNDGTYIANGTGKDFFRSIGQTLIPMRITDPSTGQTSIQNVSGDWVLQQLERKNDKGRETSTMGFLCGESNSRVPNLDWPGAAPGRRATADEHLAKTIQTVITWLAEEGFQVVPAK